MEKELLTLSKHMSLRSKCSSRVSVSSNQNTTYVWYIVLIGRFSSMSSIHSNNVLWPQWHFSSWVFVNSLREFEGSLGVFVSSMWVHCGYLWVHCGIVWFTVGICVCICGYLWIHRGIVGFIVGIGVFTVGICVFTLGICGRSHCLIICCVISVWVYVSLILLC